MNTLPRLMGSNIEQESVNSANTKFLVVTSADGSVDREVKYANINNITGDMSVSGTVSVGQNINADGTVTALGNGNFGNTRLRYTRINPLTSAPSSLEVFDEGEVKTGEIVTKDLYAAEKVELLNNYSNDPSAEEKERYVQIGDITHRLDSVGSIDLDKPSNALVRIHAKATDEGLDNPSSIEQCRTALEVVGGQAIPPNGAAIGGLESECAAFNCYGAAGFRAQSSGSSTVWIEPERYNANVDYTDSPVANTERPLSKCSFWNAGNTALGAAGKIHQTLINGDLTVRSRNSSNTLISGHGNVDIDRDVNVGRSVTINGNNISNNNSIFTVKTNDNELFKIGKNAFGVNYATLAPGGGVTISGTTVKITSVLGTHLTGVINLAGFYPNYANFVFDDKRALVFNGNAMITPTGYFYGRNVVVGWLFAKNKDSISASPNVSRSTPTGDTNNFYLDMIINPENLMADDGSGYFKVKAVIIDFAATDKLRLIDPDSSGSTNFQNRFTHVNIITVSSYPALILFLGC